MVSAIVLPSCCYCVAVFCGNQAALAGRSDRSCPVPGGAYDCRLAGNCSPAFMHASSPRTETVSPTHGLRFADTCFWVTHRRREYGPFDYEWSKDLNGVELTYAGQKFGEYCSDAEIFADLKEFQLPTSVVEVGSIVIGCIVFGLLN